LLKNTLYEVTGESLFYNFSKYVRKY